MSDTHRQTIYTIRIKGHLGQQWAAQFEDFTLTHTADGETILRGFLVDQAALHGLLRKIRDMGLELLSVNRIETN